MSEARHRAIWRKTRPGTPGYYWFYGKSSPIAEKRLHLVEAFLGQDKLTFASESQFIYNPIGYWADAILPELPEEV
jgi:hypothetical protein